VTSRTIAQAIASQVEGNSSLANFPETDVPAHDVPGPWFQGPF